MRISSSNSLGLGGAVLLSLVLSLSMVAKDKAPNTTKLRGKVFMIDKDSSTIMVDTKSEPGTWSYTARIRSSSTVAAAKARKALWTR